MGHRSEALPRRIQSRGYEVDLSFFVQPHDLAVMSRAFNGTTFQVLSYAWQPRDTWLPSVKEWQVNGWDHPSANASTVL